MATKRTVDPETLARIRRKYQSLLPEMDERRRRQWAAAEARELGWGGVTLVALATGLSRPTITAGLRELDHPAPQRAARLTRVREPGAGRRPMTEADPGLQAALDSLLEPATRGDSESPLRWTCMSTRGLAEELTRRNHRIGPRAVARLLHQSGYSLRANGRTREGRGHPDREAQFAYINAAVARSLNHDQPAISVDVMKRELAGDPKKEGRERRPQSDPGATCAGVHEMVNAQGWVSVGMDHETAQFATGSIRRWWHEMGRVRFPRARELLVTAEGGGSNGQRTRLWKVTLQDLADELGLVLNVYHFPPGTSRWNKVEHRHSSFITRYRRGSPLVSHQAIVSLIADSTMSTGLIVKAALDASQYDTEIKVSDDDLAGLRLERHEFRGDWNSTISPRGKGGP